MSMPFYVSPEQVMKDRADYARKGIARGRSLVAMEYADGIAIVAENPSGTLHKISEIYDRIGFAGVGKYNEFEMLKIAGIRHADIRGYSYSREDVTARALANAYAQTLGQVFTHEMKPYEVEILVAQVGEHEGEPNELFHILYDGTVMDEHGVNLGDQHDQFGVLHVVLRDVDVDPAHVAHGEGVGAVHATPQLHAQALVEEPGFEDVGGERSPHRGEPSHPHPLVHTVHVSHRTGATVEVPTGGGRGRTPRAVHFIRGASDLRPGERVRRH